MHEEGAKKKQKGPPKKHSRDFIEWQNLGLVSVLYDRIHIDCLKTLR